MTQGRLNHLKILHVHKDVTDKLVLTDVANDFVSMSQRREQVFGKIELYFFEHFVVLFENIYELYYRQNMAQILCLFRFVTRQGEKIFREHSA